MPRHRALLAVLLLPLLWCGAGTHNAVHATSSAEPANRLGNIKAVAAGGFSLALTRSG